MTQPIKPTDVITFKATIIPDFVIEAFNKCIAKHYRNNVSIFTQNEVIAAIIELGGDKLPEINKRGYIFTNKWLEVEEIYKENGWSVNYDKPAYNESYPAQFEFYVK